MQAYIRVIAAEPIDNEAAELQQDIDEVIEKLPRVSKRAKLSPHPRGGFSLFLDFPEEDYLSVIDNLISRGWIPCV